MTEVNFLYYYPRFIYYFFTKIEKTSLNVHPEIIFWGNEFLARPVKYSVNATMPDLTKQLHKKLLSW